MAKFLITLEHLRPSILQIEVEAASEHEAEAKALRTPKTAFDFSTSAWEAEPHVVACERRS